MKDENELLTWKTNFQNIPKGYFIASYCGKSYYAYKQIKSSKECSLYYTRECLWNHCFKFEDIDGWMPMPEGIKKERKNAKNI
jgi:hypothetical protein